MKSLRINPAHAELKSFILHEILWVIWKSYGEMLCTEILPFLRDPVTHEPLQIISESDIKGKVHKVLASIRSGRKFIIRDGIPVFLDYRRNK